MILIDSIEAKQILNSHGAPAVEVSVLLTNGERITGSGPSGLSRSSHEAVELFDKDFSVYFGKGVSHAIRGINETIAPRMKKLDPAEQEKIDQMLIELDGTPNKSHLGTNATLAVSIAVARAAASVQQVPVYEIINHLLKRTEAYNNHEEAITLADTVLKPKLPIPAFSVINGGAIGDTTLGVEEYLIYPVGPKLTSEKIRAGAEVSDALHKVLKEKGKTVNYGNTGGFVANFETVYEPLECMVEAVSRTNYHIHNQVLYGMDVAGTHLEESLPDDFVDKVLTTYPIVNIIDPFDEENFEDFSTLNTAYPRIFTSSEDLTATNLDRLYQAIGHNSIDSVVVKPNQTGTVTETLRFCKVARDAGIELIISDRSVETNDTFIVDLAIGTGAQFLKAGNVTRGERVAKYNHLLKLAEKFEV